jgi:hypothetical protein
VKAARICKANRMLAATMPDSAASSKPRQIAAHDLFSAC